jgi:hypothetical protein
MRDVTSKNPLLTDQESRNRSSDEAFGTISDLVSISQISKQKFISS